MSLHQTIRDSLPVRLGNRKYNIAVGRLARSTVDPIRQGFDTQGQPGEQSLNQAGVWKRSRDDWNLGAGQREADTAESILRQFHTSLGIDPWTKNEIKLHKATSKTHTTSGTNLYMCVANAGTERVYIADGSAVYYSENGTSWVNTNLTSPAGGAITAMASDGFYVYVASDASSGEIQRIEGNNVSNVSSPTANTDYWAIDDVDGLWVASGYLVASVGKRLTVIAQGSAPATSFDVTTSTYDQISEWKSVVTSPVGIFAAGNNGDQGRIFYINISDSTQSGLDTPAISAELPMGETINSMCAYGGYLIVATNKGIRMAAIQGQGFLTWGSRIDITNGVDVLEPQGEFVWFSWQDYNGTNTGLGRLKLSEFTEEMVPSYASDLMATTTGGSNPIQGIASLGGIRIFSVSGSGGWREQSTYITSGTINEGRFRWGVTELKAPVSIEMRHSGLDTGESVAITITSDDTTTTTITSDTKDNYTSGIKAISGVTGEYIVPSLTLTGPGSSTPVLHRWTVRAIPMPFVAEVIRLPIILTTQTGYENRDIYQDTWDDYSYIRSLLEDRALVTFKMGDESKTVYVAGISYEEGSISKWSDDSGWFEGVLTVSVVTVQGS